MANSGTNLGKAYVQIMPSARGISGSISKLLGGEAKSAGTSAGLGFGGKLVGAASKILVAAGIGKAFATSIRAGGALEQSIGGIETLFKGSANIVKGYAKNAYRDAQISANQYMEQATSFSASLLQSLDGDTKKAAKSADMAIKDMADNSAKMGTNISSIQDAYQGFAKKNYTMLDNLKLGYGGTKTEMERLLADAEKITGIKYDINNLDDVFNAIHVIQGELKISGVAADEAKTTLEGSFNAMKASAQDFAGSLALGMDIKEPLSNLITTTGTFLFGNLIPMIINIGKAIPGALVQAISEIGPVMIEQGKNLMANLGIGLSDSSPLNGLGAKLTSNLQPVINGIKTSLGFLPELFQTVSQSVMGVVDIIAGGLAKLDFSGIGNLVSAIIPALTSGFQTFSSIVGPAIQIVVDSFVGLWNAIQPVLTILATALMPIFNIVASFLGGVFKGVLLGVAGTFDMLRGVIEFLTPAFSVLMSAISFLEPILAKIAEWVGVAIGMFANLGQTGLNLSNIIQNAWANIQTSMFVLGETVRTVITSIKGFFTNLKLSAALLGGGLKGVWDAIKLCIINAGKSIQGSINSIKTFFNGLKSTGDGLWRGLKNAWNQIIGVISGAVGKISGFINRITNIFNSLRNINLFSAGKAIIDGFLRGLKHAFGAVKNFVGGIASWIKSHKGPISYDRKLLIPAGNAIIGGLNTSMIQSFKDVKSNVLKMAGEIYDGFDINVKPINLSPDISGLDKNIMDKRLDSNLDFNAYSEYKANRDSKLENMLLDILSLLKILSEKDDDVYIDGEKVSVMLGRKIDEYKKKKDLYENRRMGVVI
ncbi:MAG: phage tail protein [Anaerococcus sp.]|nr:phage tail protein [Anaerococcus sp.]